MKPHPKLKCTMARNPWANGGKPIFGAHAAANLLPLSTATIAEALCLPQLVKSAEASIPQVWTAKPPLVQPGAVASVPHAGASLLLKQAHEAFLCGRSLSVLLSDHEQAGVDAMAASALELEHALLGCKAADGLQPPREAELLLLVAEQGGSLGCAASLVNGMAAWAAAGLDERYTKITQGSTANVASRLRMTVLGRKAALGAARRLGIELSQTELLIRRAFMEADEKVKVYTQTVSCEHATRLRDAVLQATLLHGSDLKHSCAVPFFVPTNVEAAFYKERLAACQHFASLVRGRALSLSRARDGLSTATKDLEVVQHMRVRIAPMGDGGDLLSPRCFVGYLLCAKGSVREALAYVSNPCCYECLLSTRHYCSVNGYVPESPEARAVHNLCLHVAFCRLATTKLGPLASAYALVGRAGKGISGEGTPLHRIESDVLPLDALREDHYVVAAEDACHVPALTTHCRGMERAFETALAAVNESDDGKSASKSSLPLFQADAVPEGLLGCKTTLGEAIYDLQNRACAEPVFLELLFACAESMPLSDAMSDVLARTTRTVLSRAEAASFPYAGKRKRQAALQDMDAQAPQLLAHSPFLSSLLKKDARRCDYSVVSSILCAVSCLSNKQATLAFPVSKKRLRLLVSQMAAAAGGAPVTPQAASALEKQCSAFCDAEEALVAAMRCVASAAQGTVVACYFDAPKSNRCVLFCTTAFGTESLRLGVFAESCQKALPLAVVNVVRCFDAQTASYETSHLSLCMQRVRPKAHCR